MITIEGMTAAELRVDETWWEIYEDSFPTSEREMPKVILESIQRGVGMAFRAREDAVTRGLATIHLLNNPAAVFLVYLAVNEKKRSRGIGGELLSFAWESGARRLCEQHLKPIGMVWEIDPPQPEDDAGNVRQRRMTFFEKHGGRPLDPSYVQPPIDGIAEVPMILMFRPDKGQEVPDSNTKDALKRAIYFEKYGKINEIDTSKLEELMNRKGNS